MAAKKRYNYIDVIDPNFYGQNYWSNSLRTMVGVYPENITIIIRDKKTEFIKKKRQGKIATVTKKSV